MLAKIMPSTGKAFAIAGGALMSLAVLAEIVSLGAPWWTDTHHKTVPGAGSGAAELEVTLWEVHVRSVYGRFEDKSFSWGDYCKIVDNESWCHKMNTVRAMTFLAIGSGLFAIFFFVVIAIKDIRWGGQALFASFMNMIFAVCAFGLSTFYPTSSSPAVDSPAFGFIMMCWAAAISLITAIMSFFGMRYNLTPNAKSLGVTFGKACVIAAGSLVLISTVMNFIAIFAPWWTESHVHLLKDETVETNIVATLWNVELSFAKGQFETLTVSWEEYCSEKYVNEESWCHKIRSVRATMMLTIVMGAFAHGFFGVSAFKERQGFGTTAIVSAFLSMVSSVSAFSVSLFYATESAPTVDTPGFGFIIVCLASLMTLWSVLLACYGLWYSPYSGFKLVENEGSRDWKLDGATPSPEATTQSV